MQTYQSAAITHPAYIAPVVSNHTQNGVTRAKISNRAYVVMISVLDVCIITGITVMVVLVFMYIRARDCYKSQELHDLI